MLAALAMLAFSVQLVAAGVGNVAIAKITDAVEPVAPGDSYTYTLTATVGTDAVTGLRVRDLTLDFPQLSVTGATYDITGGAQNQACTFTTSNATCVVGDQPAATVVVATIDVTIDNDVQVACDNPAQPGTLDDTIRNTGTAVWSDVDGGPFTASSNNVVVDIDCADYVPDPDTTITGGPAEGSSTTSTSASFPFTGTNTPSSFECKLDAGAFAACTSPKAYSGLAVGSHTFSVRAINAGGTDATPATRTWTITGTTPPPTDHPFTDINGHPFEGDIAWLWNAGITGGCTSTLFCPNSNVSRDQMASFLDRALGLPTTVLDFFDDDEGNIHEAAINRLAASGITGGCAVRRYCPRDPVKRDQMASFLTRALTLAPTGSDFFSDDEGNIHEGAINALANSGITGGCGPGRYCPTNLVSRGQMAAFLHRSEPFLN